ncbi:MAG: TetR/AcrR family transcriptional regulator [Chloroflexota bacterium]|nr:TetR/AcrR family transcriptional regulator [Chloroflexota bacterium]
MTRPRGRPREAALDERILDATLDLLAEVGYAHMSLDDVATAAHTTRATIYLRYPSKAALTAAAIVHARRSLVLPLLTGDLRRDLVAQLRHFQGSISAPYSLPLIGAVLAEEHTAPELLAVVRQQVVASRRGMIRAILQESQSRNELAPQIDIDLAVAQLVGSYYAFAIAGEPVPPDWAERVVDQVLTGIARDGHV